MKTIVVGFHNNLDALVWFHHNGTQVDVFGIKKQSPENNERCSLIIKMSIPTSLDVSPGVILEGDFNSYEGEICASI